MATLSNEQVMQAVSRRMNSSDKYADRLREAIRTGNDQALARLIEKAVEKIFGIIIDAGRALLQRILDWFL